jgi:hypothetical protein
MHDLRLDRDGANARQAYELHDVHFADDWSVAFGRPEDAAECAAFRCKTQGAPGLMAREARHRSKPEASFSTIVVLATVWIWPGRSKGAVAGRTDEPLAGGSGT